MTEDEQHYWSALRHVHPRKSVGLERLQGHPNWASLRDPEGRTPAMWAVVKDPALWKALRPVQHRALVATATPKGRSLWFYAVLGHEPMIQERDRQPRTQALARWLKSIVPDMRQGVAKDEGLVPALLSDAGLREAGRLQGDAGVSTRCLVDGQWWTVLGGMTPLEALWSAPPAIEREVAARVWRGALLLRSQAVHVRNGGFRPAYPWYEGDEVNALVAARLVAAAAGSTLKASQRLSLPSMSPAWRTAIGAALTASLPATTPPPPLALRLWEDAAFPGPERPADLEMTDEDAWPVLSAGIAAAQLRQALPPASGLPPRSRL